ncbi:MAG: CinA family protein, partial [Nocardioides sp.]|uniref:CinA family protein n=1 Tax=Nocardioides sp. TaxID=35761 RepID=UPI003EFE9955
SRCYVGGLVTYATELKQTLVGVPEALVAEFGVVSAECARAMAEGARRVTGATYAVSTTGVAGPDSQEGHPVGTVFVGVAGPDGASVRALHLDGDRHRVQHQAVERALGFVADVLRREEPGLG